MKKLFILFFIILSSQFSFGQDTIIYWSFNDKNLIADLGGRQGELLYIGNTNMGFAQGNSTSLQDWGWLITTFPSQSQPFSSGTAGIEIHMDTRGYESIILCFDQWADSDASRWVQMDYSPDGGICWFIADWRNKGMLTPHGQYHTFSIDFSDIPEANNNANFRVRLTSSYSPLAFYQNAYVAYDGHRAYMRSNENSVYQTEPHPTNEFGSYNPNASWRFDNIIIKGIPLEPLPVNFLNFQAYAQKDFNEIVFSTSSEINNHYFEVERSYDGNRYEPIHKIYGKGNSLEMNYYEFNDYEFGSPKTFYRIKQIDFDGSTKYTEIRMVINNFKNSIEIHPTLTDGYLSINTLHDNYDISVYNSSGNRVKSMNNISQSFQLDLTDLNPGTYHIKIKIGNTLETFQIVKL